MPFRWLHKLHWVKALAVLGVLMHAGLLVRHHVQMVALASFDGGALGVLCHSDGGLKRIHLQTIPGAPASPDEPQCPLCVGALASAAVLPVVAIVREWPEQLVLDLASPDAEPCFAQTGLPPPNRGPPPVAA